MRAILLLILLLIAFNSFSQSSIKVDSNYAIQTKQVSRDEFIRTNIIGTWKDQNSTTTYREDSAYEVIFDKGQVENGKWYLQNGKLIYKTHGLIKVNDYHIVTKDFIQEYTFLDFTKDTMTIQDNSKDRTIWIAVRVKRSVIKKYGSIENEIEFAGENISSEEVDSIATVLTKIKYFDSAQKKYIWVKKINNGYELFINCKKAVKKKPEIWEAFEQTRNEMQVFFPENKIFFNLISQKMNNVIKRLE